MRQTTIQLDKRAGFDDVGHRLDLTTGAQIRICKVPSLSSGPTVPLIGTETVQERPLLSWEGETKLPRSSIRWTLTTGATYRIYHQQGEVSV